MMPVNATPIMLFAGIHLQHALVKLKCILFCSATNLQLS